MYTKEILKYIKKVDTITIFRHVGPDGDAYGSQFGLKSLISTNFPTKKVYCLGKHNPYWGKLLGMVDEVDDETIRNSLAIVVDVGDIARVDDPRFLFAKKIIKIDHHIFTEIFTPNSYEWIDNSFVAVAEMICKLAFDNHMKINKDTATALYTGIITDSGRFLYDTVTLRTFEYAMKLIKNGADLQGAYSYIYNQDENSVRFRGYCQQNFIRTPNGVGYNKITKEIIEKFHISANTGAGVVNVLSGIETVKIWVHFAEKDDGTIRVELRSKEIPVNGIAVKYGGGGHKLASGCITKNWELVDSILADLEELCSEAKGEKVNV